MAFVYNARGQLGSTPSVRRFDNADGQVITESRGKTVTKRAYDVASQVPEPIAIGSTDLLYGPDGVPIEQTSGKTADYLGTDELGSVRAILSTKGKVAGSTTYTAYGSLAGTGRGKARSPLGFAGANEDSGVLDLDSRDLEPATGQFLTVDPELNTTVAPYAYATDDPVNHTDPTGLDDGNDPLPGLVDSYCSYVGGLGTDDSESNLASQASTLACKANSLRDDIGGPGGVTASVEQTVQNDASNLPSTLRDEAIQDLAEYIGPEDAVPGLDVAVAGYALWNITIDVGNAAFEDLSEEILGPPGGYPPPPPPPPVVTCVY